MRNLSPASFALVMATGIVSVAALSFDLRLIAEALFAVNLAAFGVLSVLTFMRAALHPRLILADLVDHRTGAGFFTAVAGACLIGVQFLLIARSVAVAGWFLAFGAVLWTGLTYTIFAAFAIKREKPSLHRGLTSLWLIAAVAAQSISVLAALIAREYAEPVRAGLDFLSLSMWLWGGMLYIWIITLIFYRYNFFDYPASEIDPASWINMGATAISTLAGAELIRNASGAPFLDGLLPFLKGFTLLYWATGTWWIPLLVVLAIWRYFIARAPMRYDPAYWGAVFPLGMYSEATWQISADYNFWFLIFLARIMFAAAAAAWTLVFLGMLWDLRSVLARRAR